MQQFIDRYRREIEAVLSGFDRLVLRGSLRRLNYSVWRRASEVIGCSQGMRTH